MRVLLVAVGRIRERPLREVVDDYLTRLRRYTRFEELELKDGPAADVEARFHKALPPDGVRVALEVEGRTMGSHAFARFLEEQQVRAVPSVAFLVGGSYGLPPAVRRGADLELSLGPMTLPHRLARLVLAEQLYRAFTILRNEPYAH
ncbi:MAG: 23S rRNA (pseudouridine(1915)-N(3))-methyltransferase RlmH [Sandaracinaceae bacterium]